MMRQYELIERVERYKRDVNEALLNKAYVYAMQKHGTQLRASGDPYFSHPLEVAAILTDMRLDEATIAVGLLHDTIEDTDATRAEIDAIFGSEIGRLVEGLTKLNRLQLVSKKAVQAENLRKLLIAICDDVRVLLVKLADRLHNMRTLNVMREDKRRRIAQETMDIYAPLAGRMGMQDMREELEALAFFYLNPEAHRTVSDRLVELAVRNHELLKTIEEDLTALFAKNGISAYVKSRQKKAYSVFRKMETKGLSFEQLSDIFGFRVIVDEISDCYRALGIIHMTWPVVPGRFKDYISIPKQNDYRSLHTTIVGPSRQRVELQIRTFDMDAVAEYGVAAHSIYKDRGSARLTHGVSNETNAYAWLRKTIATLSQGDSPEEFLEHTKLELFQDQVFCFTPKGRLIALPHRATAIDFAYAVHTDVGNACVGVKINGRVSPLVTLLKNGDEVEIICAQGQVPPVAWESLVVTGKARSAIRRATRVAVRKQYGDLGLQILQSSFEAAGHEFVPELLDANLPRLGYKEAIDVVAAVGRGELASADVLKAVFPDYKEQRITRPLSIKDSEEGWFPLENAHGMLFKLPHQRQDLAVALNDAGRNNDKEQNGALQPANSAPILGQDKDMVVRFCPEGAVPGDRIVGILQPGGGIMIYPIYSKALSAYYDHLDRWVDVRWDIDAALAQRFPVHITVTVINAPGSLVEVAQAIANHDANIEHLSFVHSAPDFAEIALEIRVWDLKHLNMIISQLKNSPMVSEAKRLSESL